MTKEIKDRLDLIRNLTDRRREALLERGDTKLYDTLINISIVQISNLFEKELAKFFYFDIHFLPKEHTENTNIQENVNKLYELAKDVGVLPIKTEKTLNDDTKILVVDINYLPSVFKDKPLEDIREQLEQMYSCKVLLLDASRQNIHGSSQILPAYFI